MIVHPDDVVAIRQQLHHMMLAGRIVEPVAGEADDVAILNHRRRCPSLEAACRFKRREGHGPSAESRFQIHRRIRGRSVANRAGRRPRRSAAGPIAVPTTGKRRRPGRPGPRKAPIAPRAGSFTISALPPTWVATTGHPQARASTMALHQPSDRLARTNRSAAFRTAATCSGARRPASVTAPA